MEDLDELGATLVAISPVLVEHSRTLIEQKKLLFEILRDTNNEVAQAYGLRWTFPDDLKALYQQFGIDLAAANGDESWTLALPAIYIVDQEGVVRYARVDPDYTRRPEPLETLAALERIVR